MTPPQNEGRRHRPFVPENMKMREFTLRAVLLGLVMCVILGAANAYLGLRAGQTIAATYPAAVIGMAVLRVFKGLHPRREHRANRRLHRRIRGRRRGLHAAGLRFGESLAVFRFARGVLEIDRLMLVGSVLGVLFVSLIRRVMVEDPELPFPESVAASEIHKAGPAGAKAAKYLFYNIGFGVAVFLGGQFSLFAPITTSSSAWANWAKAPCAWARSVREFLTTGGISTVAAPPSARPSWAWDTLSDRNWPRSIFPAAWWPGACSSRC
jgi:uncharacterized oligopeptide transporter (OPT) family protein